MNASQNLIWEKYKNLFIDSINDEIDFFKKPNTLQATIDAGLSLLAGLASTYKTLLRSNASGKLDENEINSFVRTDENCKYILKSASASLDSDVASLLMCSCLNGTVPDLNQLSDDFDLTTNNIVLSNDGSKKDDTDFYVSCLYLINYVIACVIDLIESYEIPSVYRTRWLQKMCRYLAAYIKTFVKASKKSYSDLLEMVQSIKIIDALMISVVSASYVYLANRKKLQDDSMTQLNDDIKDRSCEALVEDAFDESPTTSALGKIDINKINACDVEDDVEVPTSSISDVYVTCNEKAKISESINPVISPKIITDAIVENKTTKSFVSLVSPNANVNASSKIATLDSSILYSPVAGTVKNVVTNKIYVKDLIDPDNSSVTDITNELVENYKTLFETIEFIKDYNENALYPIRLYNAGSLKVSDYVSIRDQHNSMLSSYNVRLDSYNKNVQSISTYENIKARLEDEDLTGIKDEIDDENDELLKFIKTDNDNAINSQYNTISVSTDYELFDFYISILSSINSSSNITEIEKSFSDLISGFAEKRYVIEKNREARIKDLITSYVKKLANDTSSTNYFDKLYAQYSKSKDVDSVKAFLSDLELKNTALTSTVKTQIITSTLYLFNFWLSTKVLNEKYKASSTNLKDNLSVEYAVIKKFLDDQWTGYYSILSKNEDLQAYLKNMANFSAYVEVEEDGVTYKAYYVIDSSTCYNGVDSDIKPDTKDDVKTLKYWIKYFSKITLIGAVGIGWSSGLVLPTGPVMLPVIYIPIVPIMTDYGCIVVGTTVCGVYACPFVLYVNMSNVNRSVINVNLSSIKNEIKSLKAEANSMLKTLKTELITPIMQNIKSELTPIKQDIDYTNSLLTENTSNKPVLKVKTVDSYAKWEAERDKLLAKKTKLIEKKKALQVKYKALYDFQTTGKLNVDESSDSDVKKINVIQESMNKKLSKVDALMDKIDLTLGAMPSALAPNSINFGMTPKNPKPVISIDKDLTSLINDTALGNVLKLHKKSKEDLASINYTPKSSMNLTDYYKTIKTTVNTIITNEPLPTYEKLSVTNVGFMLFANKMAVTGAKTFGIPGMSPLPL